MTDAVLGGYPAILRRWLGDDLDLPSDPGVDCAGCSHAPWTDDLDGGVDPACCNFHPRLPNYLVGQALERGGLGARRVQDRIASGDGVGVLWVEAGAWWDGVRTACPYWAPGRFSCAIWGDRGATCRAFYCLASEGDLTRWWALGVRLAHAEHHLAQRCALDGLPPAEGTSAAEWEAWYRWCARYVADLDLPTPDLEEPPRQPGLTGRRRVEPMPEVLVPTAPPFVLQGERVVFQVAAGWSRSEYPRAVFALLAAFDGERPWREALAGADLDEAVVDDLFRAGIVGPATPSTAHR